MVPTGAAPPSAARIQRIVRFRVKMEEERT